MDMVDFLFFIEVLLGGLLSGVMYSLIALGFVLMGTLFLGISIPLIDKRQLSNKPDYGAYQREVPALIPLGLLHGGGDA